MTKRGCGKELKKGDLAWDRWGLILCPECDKSMPASFMAVYYGGKLYQDCRCGDTIFRVATTKPVRGVLGLPPKKRQRKGVKYGLLLRRR